MVFYSNYFLTEKLFCNLIFHSVKKCKHTIKEQCHFSYVTEYVPATHEECEQHFEKNCHVSKSSQNQTILALNLLNEIL